MHDRRVDSGPWEVSSTVITNPFFLFQGSILEFTHHRVRMLILEQFLSVRDTTVALVRGKVCAVEASAAVSQDLSLLYFLSPFAFSVHSFMHVCLFVSPKNVFFFSLLEKENTFQRHFCAAFAAHGWNRACLDVQQLFDSDVLTVTCYLKLRDEAAVAQRLVVRTAVHPPAATDDSTSVENVY